MSLFATTKKDTQVGVEFLAGGVAVVQVQATKKSPGKILRSDYLPAADSQAQIEALQSWVGNNSLQKTQCVCLISDRDCNINQIEKPEVDDAELIQALTWRIKDLVSYDVASAVVDIYPMPVSSKNKTKQVSVVSADEATVGRYVDTIKSSGLRLVAIDIHDLVRKNLRSIQQGAGKTQAILSLGDATGELSIFHDTDLYVSRGFKIGINQLQLATSEDQSVYDSLLLEIQRSMDYFESYYGLGSVGSMEIFPRNTMTEKMALYLQNLTSFDIDFVESAQPGDEQIGLDSHCFHAYCASLRGMQL